MKFRLKRINLNTILQLKFYIGINYLKQELKIFSIKRKRHRNVKITEEKKIS